MNTVPSIDWLLLDIRHAARSLLHRPRFAAAAVLTLALGIGASTAIYSVVYGVLLRPLPYRDAERLVLIQTRDRTTGTRSPSGFSGPDFEDWRQWRGSLGSLAFCSRGIVALDADAGFETVQAAYVSRQFFAVLGAQAYVGRLLGDDHEPDIVISDRLWRRRFGADARVVGRHVRLNGAPYTIVGVAQAGVTFPSETRASGGAPAAPPEIWAPFDGFPAATKRNWRVGQIVVRLAPGRTLGEFSSQLNLVAGAFGREHGDWSEIREAVPVSLPAELSGTLRPALWLLLGAVGCVLLVACLNVANLLLARQTSRARDISLRLSLGAPRYRLIAHALSEALILAFAGGGLGVAVAFWGVAALRWLEPADLPRLDAIRVDVPILVFAVSITILAALMSAAAPAWRLLHAGKDLVVGAQLRAHRSGIRGRRVRSTLVVIELAVSLILLVAGTILTRSFLRLVGTDIGIRGGEVVTVELNVAMGRILPPARQIALADRLVAATRGIPGVRAAAVANGLPPNRSRMRTIFEMRDLGSGQPVEHRMDLLNPTSQYFGVLGIRLLRGRTFTEADAMGGSRVAILSASAARRLFGGIDVVGRTVPIAGRPEPATIVGVVGDVKYSGLAEAAQEMVYQPFAQQPFPNMTLVAGTSGDSRLLKGRLAAAVHQVDREVTVGPALTLDEVVSDAVARPRFGTALSSALAGLAMLLAVIGLYGVSAYAVAQRTAEIGVRMALGAGRWQVGTMILREGLSLAGTGAALGLAGALLLTRTLSAFVYGVTTHDAASFLMATAGLVLVTSAASLVVARRATHVDPLVALRAD